MINRLKIKITGKNPDYFLKEIIKRNINIYYLSKTYNSLTIIVDYNDYLKIIDIKTTYKIKIINYYGISKLKLLFKRYLYLIIFSVIGIFINIFLSNLVFNVEVIHPNKEIVISDIRFEHKKNGRSIDFVKSDESDGTQRLFDLIPIINDAISNNRVVIVDEIDRSLHSSLTLDLFDTFYSMRKNNSRCQLICTTHDTSLMNLEFFRKEEIWFVEKEDQVSSLYSLDKFKLKDNIANVSANYLLGKYGSIPQINK